MHVSLHFLCVTWAVCESRSLQSKEKSSNSIFKRLLENSIFKYNIGLQPQSGGLCLRKPGKFQFISLPVQAHMLMCSNPSGRLDQLKWNSLQAFLPVLSAQTHDSRRRTNYLQPLVWNVCIRRISNCTLASVCWCAMCSSTKSRFISIPTLPGSSYLQHSRCCILVLLEPRMHSLHVVYTATE